MKFRQKTKRNAPSIIIVSLIDVLMVVLIFLVGSTTPSRDLPAISLSLPTARNAGTTVASSGKPLVVSIRARAPHLRLNNQSITIIELVDIFKGIIPYVFIVIFIMVMMYQFPQIALWLPDYFFGKYIP
mgnify:CR=1 FL=1